MEFPIQDQSKRRGNLERIKILTMYGITEKSKTRIFLIRLSVLMMYGGSVEGYLRFIGNSI